MSGDGCSADYYARYIEAAQSHWWFRGRARVIRSLGRGLAMPLYPVVVVDVGSGPGGPARAVFPNHHLVAMDLSPLPLRAYAAAESRVVADADWLPCREASVAAVCAFDVLEHLGDDRRALLEWRRALVGGGYLLLTVPAYRWLWGSHDVANGHRRRYSAAALLGLLTDAGFIVERLTYFNMLMLPAVAVVRWTERWFRSHQEGNSQPVQLDCQRRFPAWIERCCEGAMALEAWWLRRRRLGAGVSLGVIARKAGDASQTCAQARSAHG